MTSTDAHSTAKPDIKSLSIAELETLGQELGLPRYRSEQLFQWLHQKGATQFAEMSNLPKELRERLEDRFSIRRLTLLKQQTSRDGTIKCLFDLQSPGTPPVEAVLIPEFGDDGAADRLTVCVSSQVGCMFGCAFCATGKMGFFRNLSHGEIVDQAQIINALSLQTYGKRITNIVFMGMGEPLHNMKSVLEAIRILTHPKGLELSPKRITVSTVGLAKQIRQLADENAPFHLAISLHAADDQKRNKIMPINASLDLSALREALQAYYQALQRPVTYEYLLFDEFNDHPSDAQKLADIASWIPSKVNIIMYNNVAGVALKRAREKRLNEFMRRLVDLGVRATVRRSRGDDIDAGCGQLAIREGIERGKTIANVAAV